MHVSTVPARLAATPWLPLQSHPAYCLPEACPPARTRRQDFINISHQHSSPRPLCPLFASCGIYLGIWFSVLHSVSLIISYYYASSNPPTGM